MVGFSQPVVPPSPVNIAPIYLYIQDFDEQVTKFFPPPPPSSPMPERTGMKSFGLKFFVDEYINTTFMQYIKTDYRKRLEACMEGSDAFKPLKERQKNALVATYSGLEGQRPLLTVRFTLGKF
jgi:hypothetical protein